jgi:O-antigen ligase
MLLDGLLASSLLLSTATQLRMLGSAVGPGEAGLALWIFLVLGREAARPRLPVLTPTFFRMMIFWMLTIIALGLGTFMGVTIESNYDWTTFTHSIVATLLAAILTCMCAVGPDVPLRLDRVTWLLVGLGTAVLVPQMAAAWGLVDLPFIDIWYYNRLRGWSANPNQLAFLCLILVFLALHLAKTTPDRGWRLLALAMAAVPFHVGLLTHSDAFVFALMIGGAVTLTQLYVATLRRSAPTLGSIFAWLGPLLLLVPLIATAPALKSSGAEWALSVFEEQGQGDDRLHLWSQAMQQGIDSAMMGLGPGPHVVTEDLAGERSEAHNTVLDLFTQGGAILLLAFLWLLATIMLEAQRRQQIMLTGLLLSVLLFSMFHLIFRHPIFWFAVTYCAVAGAGRHAALPMPARD